MRRYGAVLVLLLSASLISTPCAAQQDGARELRTANALLQRGLFAEAAAEYQTAIERLNDRAQQHEARYGLAVALYQLGSDEDALRILDGIEADDAFPFRTDAAVLRTHLLTRLNRFADAADAAAEATSDGDHPSWPATAALRIELLHRAARHDDARRVFRQTADHLADRTDAAVFGRAAYFAGLSAEAAADSPSDHKQAAEILAHATDPGVTTEISDAAHLRRAHALRRAGEPDAAIEAFRIAVSEGSPSIRGRASLGLGSLLRAQHRPHDAIEVLDSLRGGDLEPAALARGRFELGLALLETGEPRKAARALDAASEDAPPDLADDIAYWRAKADLRRDRAANAVDRLTTALAAHPGSNVAAEIRFDLAVAQQRAGDLQAAFESFAAFTQQHPRHTLAPDALYAEASLALALGEHAIARQRSQAFQRSHPQHPRAASARLLGAEAAYRMGDPEDAAQQLSELTGSDDPELAAQAGYTLGMSLHALGRTDEAFAHLKAAADAADKHPEFVPALLALAEAESARGNWNAAADRAGAFLQTADTATEAHATALLSLAIAHARRSMPEEAAGVLRSLLEEHPHSPHTPHALFEYGQALITLGRDDRAEQAFDQLLQQAGDSRFAPHAARHLGGIAARAGRMDEAAEHYARARRSGPRELADAVAVEQARALLDAGENDQAARTLRGIGGEAAAWRAIAFSRSGDHEAAVATAERIQHAPADPAISAILDEAIAASLRAVGRTDDATRRLERLLEGDAETACRAALQLADISIDNDDHRAAAEVLERALESRDRLSPTLCAAAAYKAAWCRYRLDQPARVIDLLSDLPCELGALAAPASMVLGEAMLTLGRAADAAEQFAAVLDNNPDSELAASALLRLGEAHASAQNWRASRRAYQRHREDHSSSDRWFTAEFGIGWALENAGRPEDAIEHYTAVTARHEGETAARAQFQIGECLFAIGRHEQAVRELLRVDILYAHPRWSPAALYEAGRCYEAMNKIGEARAQYRAVRERFADSDWAEAAHERLEAISGPGGS